MLSNCAMSYFFKGLFSYNGKNHSYIGEINFLQNFINCDVNTKFFHISEYLESLGIMYL